MNHSCNSLFLAILVSVKRASVSHHDFLWIFVQRTLRLAIPDFSSIPSFHGYFGYEHLKVLFLVEPVLLEVWLALFEILHTHNLHYPCPTMRMSLSLKYAIASVNKKMLQDFSLRFRKHVISVSLKKEISHNFPGERISITVH